MKDNQKKIFILLTLLTLHFKSSKLLSRQYFWYGRVVFLVVIMYYIVGLGNPGSEYTDTRHNVAWLILDYIAETIHASDQIYRAALPGQICEGVLAQKAVTLFYPDTYMNHSGVAVKKLVKKNELAELLVLHDDIALPLGTIKVSSGRGDGGHNGVKSIIEQLGTKEFTRIRIGIGAVNPYTGLIKRPSGEALPKFVLGHFTKKELATLDSLKKSLREVIEVFVAKGAVAAMNQGNR